MPKPTTSAAIGALVREHREAAELTQTQLALRIGASRFWVAAFEKGKPSAELGLALKAIQAVGLTFHIEPESNASLAKTTGGKRNVAQRQANDPTQLRKLLAHSTIPAQARSHVAGWPGATATVPEGAKKAKRTQRVAS